MPPTVTIIMRAKDEMPHVGLTLAALKSQTFTDAELYAVDSGSTDGTLEQLENYGGELARIPPESYVPGKVLNNAIAQSDAEIIVLLNADAIPQSDHWLDTLVQPIIREQTAVTFSRQVPRPDARFIVAYDYARAFNPEKMQAGFFSAVACALPRSLWQKHRFPEDGYAEDARWAKTVLADGAPVRFMNDSVVEHSHNYSLASLYRKRFRQAQAFGGQTPGVSRIMLCLREIVRDLLHAAASWKMQTIPYNIAYRITIHRAMYKGSKSS